MATLFDPLTARLQAILTGAYPIGAPYLPAGIFTFGTVTLPHQNPAWPSGDDLAATDRRFDLVWSDLDFDPPGVENGSSGPWTRKATFTLAGQYAHDLPPPLHPRDQEFALGGVSAASQKGLEDATAIEWALLQPGAWDGAAIGYGRVQPIRVGKVDEARCKLVITGYLLFLQSAAARPQIQP